MALLYFFVLGLSLCYTASAALTTTQKRKILDLHNQLRDRVAGGGLINAGHPAATDMNSLIWDDGLAKLVENYIKKCDYPKHNPKADLELLPIRDRGQTKWGKKNGKSLWTEGESRIWVGENLAANDHAYTIERALNQIEVGWFDEYKSWKWGPAGKGCSRTYCTHYTQMVWANTRYIGCAWVNGCNGKNIMGCNYFPLGNLNSATSKPYTPTWTVSKKASNCMTDRTMKGTSFYQNVAPYTPSTKKYNALCGGGACATQCDGDATGRKSCDECTSTTADCNDGTTSRTSGRNICTDGKKTVVLPPTNTITCKDPAKPFPCKDGSKCIPQSYVCDKYRDCPDSSDLADCHAYNGGQAPAGGTSTSNTNTGSTGSTSGSTSTGSSGTTCTGCVEAKYIRNDVNKQYCKRSSKHNGKPVWVNTASKKAIYHSGKYWYLWNWSGSISALKDSHTVNNKPYAYCAFGGIAGCNGNWFGNSNGKWVKKAASSIKSCAAMESLECMDGYNENVCTAPHDTSGTNFVFDENVTIAGEHGYEWRVMNCINGKPMYSADGYFLSYDERTVYDEDTDTRTVSPFWVVSSEDEEYAHCNEEELSDCSAGSWQKMISRHDTENGGFIGYEVDGTMATNECGAVAATVNNNNNAVNNYVVLAVSVLVLALFVVIGCCVTRRRLRNTTKGKEIVADADEEEYADTKTLAENDEMQEVDATQMLQEIEVEIEVEN